MENNELRNISNQSYGSYILMWIGLMILTITAIAVSGINLGNFTKFSVLIITAMQVIWVLYIFMQLKIKQKILKILISVTGVYFLVLLMFLFLDKSL